MSAETGGGSVYTPFKLAADQLYSEETVARMLVRRHTVAIGEHAFGLAQPGEGYGPNPDFAYKDHEVEPSRRLYKGPIFAQGPHATCGAWSVIHDMHAIGRPPLPPFATRLLNATMPDEQFPEGGISIPDLADVVSSEEAGVGATLPYLGRDVPHPAEAGELVQTAIDGGSALVAMLLARPRRGITINHIVGVVGYDIGQDGSMALQVIDSKWGERVVGLSGLIRNTHPEIPGNGSWAPDDTPIAVISPR